MSRSGYCSVERVIQSLLHQTEARLIVCRGMRGEQSTLPRVDERAQDALPRFVGVKRKQGFRRLRRKRFFRRLRKPQAFENCLGV